MPNTYNISRQETQTDIHPHIRKTTQKQTKWECIPHSYPRAITQVSALHYIYICAMKIKMAFEFDYKKVYKRYTDRGESAILLLRS